MKWFSKLFPRRKPITPQERARQLIAAVDAGGLPMHAGIVNDIAREIGLDVATNAPMSLTIERIRRTLKRQSQTPI